MINRLPLRYSELGLVWPLMFCLFVISATWRGVWYSKVLKLIQSIKKVFFIKIPIEKMSASYHLLKNKGAKISSEKIKTWSNNNKVQYWAVFRQFQFQNWHRIRHALKENYYCSDIISTFLKLSGSHLHFGFSWFQKHVAHRRVSKVGFLLYWQTLLKLLVFTWDPK